MPEQSALPRLHILLLCILGSTFLAHGFPRPRLPLRTTDGSEEPKEHTWDVFFPSVAMRDWSISLMSGPRPETKRLMTKTWLTAPESEEAGMDQAWSSEWPSREAGMTKRNMVVADDAAFREKSKLLTSMERQKWLNTYMQKLLVVDSS
uniref:Tuberoinfundibular peptide of 39 residues n=1 Tax=Cynoglossus semilaevis TaxID=244447 RepID=A0A3P8WKC8_CYNSE